MTKTIAILGSGLLAAMLCVPASAAAQTVTPVTATSPLTFTASADHNLRTPFGVDVVERYDFEIRSAADAIVYTRSLGKPTPGAANEISVPIGADALKVLTSNAVFSARVAAVGPGGAGRSLPSNPFGVPGPVGLPAAPTGLRVAS